MKLLQLTLLSIGLASCANSKSDTKSENIYTGCNFLGAGASAPKDTNPLKYQHMRKTITNTKAFYALGRLESGGKFCTALHVGNDIVLTAAHCIKESSQSCSENVKVTWAGKETSTPTLSNITVGCKNVLTYDSLNDLATIELDTSEAGSAALSYYNFVEGPADANTWILGWAGKVFGFVSDKQCEVTEVIEDKENNSKIVVYRGATVLGMSGGIVGSGVPLWDGKSITVKLHSIHHAGLPSNSEGRGAHFSTVIKHIEDAKAKKGSARK